MTMITPSYLGETIEYSSLHACRSTLEDPTTFFRRVEVRLSYSEPDNWLSLPLQLKSQCIHCNGCGRDSSSKTLCDERHDGPE